MCSIPGLPMPGSNVRVLITRVNLNPLCVLVELWANFDQERKLLYQQMRREIQFPGEIFQESHGSPGDLCLVKVFETWYRARVVSRNGPDYNVFLIDEGRTLSANTSILARGHSDFFHLPPEVEFCVLANVLPLSVENRWSPMALEFLKSLCGKTVDGIVQDVLVPHRTFLLEMPSISKQMYEMGFAKKLSAERFKLYVTRSLKSFSGISDPADSVPVPSLRNEPVETCNQNEKWQQFLYPELQTETVETVIITEVTNPLRVFCQLKVFSQELRKLTDQITQYYEGRLGVWKATPEHLGFPCAARGSDGKWYRSVLQQVLSSCTVVEVLHVDYGKKDFVPVENVRPLAAEFFRMPVVTYVCSLYGIIDKGIGWTAAQINYLKSLLLHRTLIAKFEYQSLSEGVHYVTLFGDENVNINILFGKMEKCLLQYEKKLGDFGLRKKMASMVSQDSLESEKIKSSVVPSSAPDQTCAIIAGNLLVNSSHVVVTQHVKNPSEFWIQTQCYNKEFDQLMNGISDLYDQSASTEAVLKKLATGIFCVAKSRDNVFYRAVIHEVSGKQAKVHMVDYGNTEVVDQCNLRVLPDQFRKLPALALQCTVSGIKPKSGKWSHSAIVFFSKAVENKLLDAFVNSVSQDRHFVQLSDPSACGERNIGKMLISAGFAEVELKTLPRVTEKSVSLSSVPAPSIEKRETSWSPSLPTSLPNVSNTRSVFKEHLFLIGSCMEVNVSYIESPNDFWCQLAQNAGGLRLLMEDIQNFYTGSKPQQLEEAACVARHPDNGMWYRALVIQKHASQNVDVLFIDYGQSKKVPLQDLRPINPMFLKMKGQAFRCSLYNLIHPVNMSTFEWGNAAEAEFKNFVDSAASANMSLKCTIYAVMCDSRSVVFNVVDLETPFQSVCSVLVQKGLANRALPKKVPLPPFRLDTYYYSTHEIKTGGEEAVKITSVKSVRQFFCQLERNSKTVEELSEKVNYLCHQLQSVSCPKTFGTVCFAKYTDGYWYRGQIKSASPTIQVYFVDYGDMLELDKADLLPIPIEAGEIMSVPVQAIECGLADLPENVPAEINNWFEKTVTEQSFIALVVAKEPDGKLMVELYDGKTQVNSKIKEKFHIETWRKESVSLSCNKYKKMQEMLVSCMQSVEKDRDQPTPKQAFEAKGKLYKRIPSVAESEHHKQDFAANWKPGARASESGNRNKMDIKKQESTKKYSSPGIQWKPIATLENSVIRMKKQSPPSSRVHPGGCRDVYGVAAGPNKKNKSFSKLSQLPEKSIKAGQISEVYVSHINSPSSFFVQLTEDEAEIYSLVDKINGDLSCSMLVNVDELQEGDLVNAVFPDDGSWYRGVVQNVFGDGTVQVEFIDFGNTATVAGSRISRFDSALMALPRLSIHCSLSGVTFDNKGGHWGQEDVGNFTRAVGENGSKKLMCRFSKQLGSVWEVVLEDHGIMIVHLFQRLSLVVSDATSESLQRDRSNCSHLVEHKDDVVSLIYKEPNISEGLTLKVYASSITGPHYFWCQYADTDELQRISEAAKEIDICTAEFPIWAQTLCPGSPCLALFAEDEQWYRAKVVKKAENALSVLFVDYGNESVVDFNKVKPVTPPLLETPPQAFLCQLDGFELSQCSWTDLALDQFACLITDRVLTVTVIKVTSVSHLETPPYHVRVECDGNVINDIICNKNKLSPCTDYLVTACSEEFSATEFTETCDSTTQLFDGQEVVASSHKGPHVKASLSSTDDSSSDLNEQKELLSVSDSNNTAEQQLEISVRFSPVEEPVAEGLISEDQVFHEYSTLSEIMEVNGKNEKEAIKEKDLMALKVVKDIPILAHVENDCLTQMGCNLEGMQDLEDEHSLLSNEILSSRHPDVPVNVDINKGLSKSQNETEVSQDTTVADAVLMAVSPQGDSVVTNGFCSQASKILEEIDKFSLQGRENESDTEKMSLLDEASLLSREDEIMDLLGPPECEQPDGDIYEEVFRQCLEESVDSPGAADTPLENGSPSTQSSFGTPKVSEDAPLIGAEYIIWSHAHKMWCRAKIIKVFDSSVQVLLLDDDSHAIVDVQNIFKRIPEDLDQKAVFSEFGNQQDGSEEHCIEPDGRIDCCTDQQLVAATEELVLHRTPKLPGRCDLTEESFDGQGDLPDNEVL